ncbi:PAS/PAC sensor hybrid histidine kinase [Candidatus Moduliflexus flocculans]|uniref:histidine kinase n=1 Tax=Candidatus Moduliflexus flocculans TaxID=1499966 RepID=A0A0S6VXS8_9BACT|nr:PAS/PAC sensor hybrid histidine kinase [Candidatus Moduliflexus flocculans]
MAGDVKNLDARVLGQLFATQNILFVLPTMQRIAEFYAKAFVTVPGVRACRVCLGDASVQEGEFSCGDGVACAHLRSQEGKFATFAKEFECRFRDVPNLYVAVVETLEHRFGFFIFRIDQPDIFDLYQPFLSNVANFVALSLENRLQRNVLQKARDELECRVAERTAELNAVNRELNAEIEGRKRVEEALRASEANYRCLVETATEGIWMVGPDTMTIFVNTRMAEILGYQDTDMLGRPVTDFMFKEDTPDHLQKMANRRQGIAENYERRFLHKDGRIVWVHASATPIFDTEHHFKGSFAMLSDITERKQVEEAQRRLNRELRAISTCNQILMRAVDEQSLLNDICRIICDEAGYRMAWVGYAEHDETQTVRPVAWAGVEDGYLADANITWADTERGHGPTGTAIRTGNQTCIQNFMTDPQVAPWRESALQRGYRSSLAFPLKDERAVTFGALNIYATEPNAFTTDEIRLLEELAGDLAFGIVALRTRIERNQAEIALRESEQRVRRKLDAILSPETDISTLELSDIIDSEKIQKLMDEFYRLTNIGIGIIDLHGNVLVGTGWQDICAKFHRMHPESRQLCLESDLELSRNVPTGTFKQYRCKLNMWDIATPIMLGDKHVGNIFLGQFLFDDETPDYEIFRQQAQRYGFNTQEYLAALDRVPRWNRNTVNAAMSFYAAFAGLIGNLSYSNIKLANALEERKRAEAEIRKLSQAVEQSPEAIVITDPAGTIQYVNPRFTDMTGYLSEEAIGKNLRILKSGETSLAEYQQLWNTITHGSVWRGEFHNKKKNNDLYWEAVSISPVVDSQGNITHFVAVKEDITARKQAEEALRLLNEELEVRVSQRTAELEAANKELQEFAYIVSHDLKAPLRGISRLTQWIQADYTSVLDANGQEQLELLGEQVKRMDTLIDGILRYSRAAHSSEREESVDLNMLVSQVIDMLMPPAHIAIRLEGLLPVIQGDPIQITQVFQNLLSNAVKFLDKPTGMITITSEDAGENWVFRVEDNGPGIEPRHHERIFKIFQSVSSRNDRDSTGIGLAVVKKIVEFYGGRVWVESEPGQGSRFYFSWPKRIGEDV